MRASSQHPFVDLTVIEDLRAAARRLIRRHRRAIVAGLLVLAALSAVTAIGADDAQGRQVVVATRSLPAGHALTDSDLATASVPALAVADDAATDGSSLIGRRIATPVSAREPLTPGRLIAATTGSPGAVITTVRLADPQVTDLLHTGDVVDVLAARSSGVPDLEAAAAGSSASPAPAMVIASGVRVVGIPRATGTGSGLWNDESGSPSGLILLEVEAATAARLAGAGAASRLSVTVRPQ
jgi:Flp pilus assembly protein CpaB